MRLFKLPALALVLMVGWLAARNPAQDAKAALIKLEWKKLQGVWALTSLKEGTKAIPEERITAAAIKLIIEPGRASIKEEAKTVEVSLTIDPAKSPKQIDMRGTPPGQKPQTASGIYKLEGDTLTICYDPSGKNRPTEFKAQPGPNQVQEAYRREKQ
jgi:uncharacterized protein (TIGR03067 family)